MNNQKYIYTDISFANVPLASPHEKKEAANAIYTNADNDHCLTNLSRVNFFIGANNSGKSRFLRTVFLNEDFTGAINFDLSILKIVLEEYKNDVKQLIADSNIVSYNHVRDSSVELIFQSYFLLHTNLEKDINSTHLKKTTLLQLHNSFFHENFSPNRIENAIQTFASNLFKIIRNPYLKEPLVSSFRMLHDQYLIKFESAFSNFPTNKTLPTGHIYIPVNRGLRKYDNTSVFAQVTTQDYFHMNPKHHDHFIKNRLFNGYDTYDELKHGLLNSSVTREKVVLYENFLSREFFYDQKIQISPKPNDTAIHIKVGDQPDLPIYALGDGMQSIILLTYKAFFAEENCLFFAEEPEVYLHPGLQRSLVEVILRNSYLNRHQWFFTTHSNHFLDLTLDYDQISVHSFSKNSQGVFRINRMRSPDPNVLSEIGVLPSSVFRVNSLIWVEGLYDRKYLREILRKYFYQKNISCYKEDIHYSIIELGGGNNVHFNFKNHSSEEKINIKSIADKSFLLLDGDNFKKGNRKQDFDSLPDQFKYTFPQKEFENILPPDALKYAITKIIESSHLDDKDSILSRVEDITYAKYSKTNCFIGNYLDKTLHITNPYFRAESGTIKQKGKLCSLVTEYMMSEENTFNLSPACSALAEKIHLFIKNTNPSTENHEN